MARVAIVSGGPPRTVPLEGNLVVVGTDASCAVRVESDAASPVHCELRKGPEGWRVVDLESRAGTKVNGDFVNTRHLRPGDSIDVAGVVLRFEDDAPAASPPQAAAARPAAPAPRATAARSAAPRPAAKGGAPARGAPASGEGEARPARRPARKSDNTTVLLGVGAGVAGLALVGWLLFKNVTSETHNHHVRVQMAEAERRMEWQRVLDLARDAQRDDSYDWKEIQAIEGRARAAIAGEATGQRVEESIRDWSAVRYWRQDHRGDDAEYVAQIDDFLRKYAGLECASVKEARSERVKVAGTSAVAGAEVTGDSAWSTALADARALEADGRFGAAVAKIDEYWKAHGASAPTRIADVEAEKKRLVEAADKWFGRQVALAVHYLGNGERKKAERHLSLAAEKIGLPGFAERARAETERILALPK